MSIQCPSCLELNTDNTLSCITCGNPLITTAINSSALKPGTLLIQGKYRIEKVLGQGGFGITYKATCVPTAASVAIKELWPENAARQGNTVIWPFSIPPIEQQKQITKFQQEASNLKKCVHPNIVKVYDCFQEFNSSYMVMELLSGKSLDKILQAEGPLDENRVKNYFLQLAESLKVIHAHNLLHRDIKPENIIIVDTNRPVLIDFGAAREFITGQTGDMTRILTAEYAPYEQYLQTAKRSPATDFYALSASMYELLTGELPVTSAERAYRLSSQDCDPLTSPRKFRTGLSILIEKIILTGMQFRVEDRFQTADELIDALKGKFISPVQKRAHNLVKEGKLSEAIKIYQKLLNSEPDNGEVAVELALVLIYVDDGQAELVAEKAIKLREKDGRGYGILGLINCHRSNWKEAINYLQQAANLSPQEVWIQANLAWALGKCGNWIQAESTVNLALAKDANCIFALSLQAWIYFKKYQWESVIKAGTQAVFQLKQQTLINPLEIKLWVYPFLIYALEKVAITRQANDVERRIQEFINQVPDSSIVWGLKGWKKAKNGFWQDALSSFEQASRKTEVPSWVIINYGITQENMQNTLGAIQVYEIYTEKFPPCAFVYFRLGSLTGKMGQWARAKLHLEKAIQLNGNYAAAYHNLGWVLLNLRNPDGQVGDFRQMLSAYRRAIELYTLQQNFPLATRIKKAFQLVDIEV